MMNSQLRKFGMKQGEGDNIDNGKRKNNNNNDNTTTESYQLYLSTV